MNSRFDCLILSLLVILGLGLMVSAEYESDELAINKAKQDLLVRLRLLDSLENALDGSNEAGWNKRASRYQLAETKSRVKALNQNPNYDVEGNGDKLKNFYERLRISQNLHHK